MTLSAIVVGVCQTEPQMGPVYPLGPPDMSGRKRRRTRQGKPCVWPDCRKRSSTWPKLPLCDAHVLVVRANSEPEQPPPEPKPAPPRDGVVYFVKNSGHIKIGWTVDLAKRMRAYPPGSELLACHPGTRADEARLHKRFKVHLSHGREWYPLVPPLIEHIKSIVREHGEPDAVDFMARPVTVPRPHSIRQGPTPRGFVGGRGQVRA